MYSVYCTKNVVKKFKKIWKEIEKKVEIFLKIVIFWEKTAVNKAIPRLVLFFPKK